MSGDDREAGSRIAASRRRGRCTVADMASSEGGGQPTPGWFRTYWPLLAVGAGLVLMIWMNKWVQANQAWASVDCSASTLEPVSECLKRVDSGVLKANLATVGFYAGVALFLAGVIAGILQVARIARAGTRGHLRCPHCRSRVNSAASVCRHCGRDI